MKYDDIITRISTLNYIPVVGLDDEARATVTLNVVAYEKAIADFEQMMSEAKNKLKGKGFDDKMAKFGLAITPPKDQTEEQTKEIEALKADPDFDAFRKEYEEWEQRAKTARKKAEEEHDIEVRDFPLAKHLAAISRVLPAGGKMTLHAPDGSDIEISYQSIFYWVAELASKQK